MNEVMTPRVVTWVLSRNSIGPIQRVVSNAVGLRNHNTLAEGRGLLAEINTVKTSCVHQKRNFVVLNGACLKKPDKMASNGPLKVISRTLPTCLQKCFLFST